MGLMSRFAWLLAAPALAGCFLLPSGERSQVGDVPGELCHFRFVPSAVPDRHLYGAVGAVKVGQWATYRENGRTVTVAAVARVPEGTWIEVIEEGEVRQASALLVAPDGAVRKAFYQEIGREGKSGVEPQALEQWTARASSGTAPSMESSEEAHRVLGKDLKVRAVKVSWESLDGRLLTEASLWHRDVPAVYASLEGAGLIRKQSAEQAVELVGYGADAKPLVEIPK